MQRKSQTNETLEDRLQIAGSTMEEALQFVSGTIRWASIARSKLDEDDTKTREGMREMENEARRLFDELNETLNAVMPNRRSRYERSEGGSKAT